MLLHNTFSSSIPSLLSMGATGLRERYWTVQMFMHASLALCTEKEPCLQK